MKPNRTLTISICMLLVGCTSKPALDQNDQSQTPQMPSDPIQVIFLTRDGCANTPVLRANLESAAESFDSTVEYEVIDQGTLPATDAHTGYPTPTILYKNRDLFGLPEPVPPFPAPS
jgi:hypothetical protein